MKSWERNSRGEWYVIVQISLMIGVFLAAKWDGKSLHDRWTSAQAILGGILFLAGMVFAGLGTLALGRNLSPFPKPLDDSQLVARGAYAVVRHPIYCGIIFLAFGWSVAWESLLALIASAILFLFFDSKARREERWLEEKFANYTAYKKRVKKLIPFVY